MKKHHEKDSYLVSFLDFMYIEKGLSKNTVESYKSDLLDAYNWSASSLNTHLKDLKKNNIEEWQTSVFPPFLQLLERRFCCRNVVQQLRRVPFGWHHSA